MLDEQERYKLAKERVAAIKGFWVHFFTYILVNAGLFLVNLLTREQGGNWWFYWPLVGWGIGLAAHAFSVYGAHGIFGPEWEERKIRELMEKDKEPKDTP